MKIAITGHKHGIGKAFAEQLSARGHEIIGISRSDGENIRRIEHTANIIDPCKLFINNAQSMFAQTELLYAVWKKWYTVADPRWIWNISTQMVTRPTSTNIASQYRNQKIALEEASIQLQYKEAWPKISVIRPGEVATHGNWYNTKSDVNVWVKSVIDTFTQNENLHVTELSIGHTDKHIPI